jgi:hypothetical protein
MSIGIQILRPNLVKIETRNAGTQSQTGSPQSVVQVTNPAVPALVDLATHGEAVWKVQGEVFLQDAELFMDGLHPSQFVGVPPLGTIVINGVTYTVKENGLGAFPDLYVGDRITDEHGTQYLVLAVSFYDGPFPAVQAMMSRGRAWGG